jgi:hypothetical protein
MNKAEANFQILLDHFNYIRSFKRVARVGTKTEKEHIDTILRCNQLDANCVGVIDEINIKDADNIVLVRTATDDAINEQIRVAVANYGAEKAAEIAELPDCEYVVKEYHRKEVFKDGETLSTWADQDDIHYGKD